MNIIGISGLAGSGKDAAADILLQREGFIRVSLADPIKRFAQDVWGFSDRQLWGASEFRNAPDLRYPIGDGEYLSPRKVLQHVGTEGTRAIDHDVWIRYAIRTATRLLMAKPKELCYSSQNGIEGFTSCYPPENFKKPDDFPSKVKAVVIADVRFINECTNIKQAGGLLLKIVRPGAGLQGNFAAHQSESEMSAISDSDFDCIIENNGTLDDLKVKVNEFADTFCR